jgi:phosphoserine phosphatase
MATGTKLLCLDCDATLSGIEGVDELARLRGPAVLAQVAGMTAEAMDGKIPLEQVFARRLELIRPSEADLAALGRLYIEQVDPAAREAVQDLKAAGWTPLILSAGYTQAIAPLASHLGIGRIEAVRLVFDRQGSYVGFDERFPTTRAGGKSVRIAELRRELQAGRVVMVGDGVSDLETREAVDLFVGFGGYAERPRVKSGAGAFIHSFSELPALLY